MGILLGVIGLLTRQWVLQSINKIAAQTAAVSPEMFNTLVIATGIIRGGHLGRTGSSVVPTRTSCKPLNIAKVVS